MVTALTGFMGSGKSSVGRALSELLCVPFIDLDEYIMQKEGKRITEIFDAQGEEGFRALESQALSDLLADGLPDTDMVLSLGGGTILRKDNAALIARKCKCVFLRTSASTLRARLQGERKERPLLRGDNLEQLLSRRTPAYERAADIVIDTDGLTPEQIAKEIAKDKTPPAHNNRGIDLYRSLSIGIKESSTEAFEILFRAEFENIKFFINKYIHNSAEAEDIAQETFSTLWNRREELNSSLSIKSYLYTIAKNKALNYLGSLRTRMTEKYDIAEIDLFISALNDEFIISKIDALDMKRIINIAMDHLPQTTREIFRLNREEDLTYDEIAARLGLTTKQVEYNIVKALKHFRKKLSYN